MEYVISMDSNNFSRLSSTCVGKFRSNFLGTKFIIYDTQPPYTSARIPAPGGTSCRFYSKKVSREVPLGSCSIAQITYELNDLGTRGPRRMHSIPASALDAGGIVTGQPELLPCSLDNSFRSMTFSKSLDHSVEFSSSVFSEISAPHDDDDDGKLRPLILKNKPLRWLEQLQCWCLDFRGQLTVVSIKNFQLIATTQPVAGALTPSLQAPLDHGKIVLQFVKAGEDMSGTIQCFAKRDKSNLTCHLATSLGCFQFPALI